MSYIVKGNNEYLVCMVKSFAATKKQRVRAEWSDDDSDALQRHVFKRSRCVEDVHIVRLHQRSFRLRQEAAQTNIESATKNTVIGDSRKL